MNTHPEGYTKRNPSKEDAAEVLALIEVCESAEYGTPDTDAESLQEDWLGVDLAKDALLFYDLSNRLVGYAAVARGETSYQIDFYPHPECEWIALGDYLLEQSLRRVREYLSAAHSGDATIRSYCAHTNTRKLDMLENFGFCPERYHLQMQIEFDRAPAAANFPSDFSLRTLQAEPDAKSVYALMKTAFERPGHPFPDYEAWASFMIETPQFESDLWFMLERDDVLVGASLCYEYPSYGWVRQLGVLPAWRSRGLGRNLLLHSFKSFYQRGCKKVALGVAAENANAKALYENAGMHVARQYDEYILRIGN